MVLIFCGESIPPQSFAPHPASKYLMQQEMINPNTRVSVERGGGVTIYVGDGVGHPSIPLSLHWTEGKWPEASSCTSQEPWIFFSLRRTLEEETGEEQDKEDDTGVADENDIWQVTDVN